MAGKLTKLTFSFMLIIIIEDPTLVKPKCLVFIVILQGFFFITCLSLYVAKIIISKRIVKKTHQKYPSLFYRFKKKNTKQRECNKSSASY